MSLKSQSLYIISPLINFTNLLYRKKNQTNSNYDKRIEKIVEYMLKPNPSKKNESSTTKCATTTHIHPFPAERVGIGKQHNEHN